MKFIKKIIFMFLIGMCILNLVACSPLDSSATRYVEYNKIRTYMLYHHIKYNDTHYYLMDISKYDIPENMTPKVSESVDIILVDKDGSPYQENCVEKAHLYYNDSDNTFLYFDDATYTKDLNLVSKATLD